MSDYSEAAMAAADDFFSLAPRYRTKECLCDVIYTAISAARKEAFEEAAKWHLSQEIIHKNAANDAMDCKLPTEEIIGDAKMEAHHESGVYVRNLAAKEGK